MERREAQRQLIIRAGHFVRHDEFQVQTLTQLSTRLRTLNGAYDRFTEEHLSIVEDVLPEDMIEQNELAAEVQELYMNVAAVIEQRMEDLRLPQAPPRTDAAVLQAILNNRDNARDLIVHAQEFTNSDQFEEQSLTQLENRLLLINQSYEEVLLEHRKLTERAVEEQTIRDNRDFAVETQEIYLTVKTKVEEKISILRAEQLQPIQVDPANLQLPRLADFRLESIKVPSFNGDYFKWNEWRSLYDSLIHKQVRLSDTEKFHYLKRSLSGTAEQVLSGWHTVGENYPAAYDALVNVFNNSYRIVMAHLDTLHKLPRAANETAESLRNMIDTANRVIRQLRVAGSPVDHWDHLLVYTLVSRMSTRTLTHWETTQDLAEMPTLEAVLKFLERRARGILNLSSNQVGSERPRNPNANSNEQRPRTDNRPARPSSSIQCYKCNGPHPLYRCEEVTKKPLAERERIIANLKLCKSCFRKDHEAGSSQCRAEKCKVCKKEFHNPILCPRFKGVSIATVNARAEAGSSQDFQ